jgi:hypothetical protein
MMDKVQELISLCKNSIGIHVNEHRDFYESVDEYLKKDVDKIPADILNEMIQMDTVIYIHVYPRNAISFFSVYHYDLESALDIILNSIKNDK